MKSALRKLRNASPVPMTGAGFYGLPGLSTRPNNLETYMSAYGRDGTTFATVSLIAQATARPEWHLYKKQPKDGRVRYTTNDSGSDQRTEVVSHAALTVLGKPNPYYTRFRLFETDQLFMELTGECYWLLTRNGVNFPTGIWPIRPDRMEPVPDPVNYLAGWVYTSPDGKQRIPLKTSDVIQVAYPNPLDPLRGLGPVQSVLTDIDGYRYSSEWNRNFYVNSARPDGVITVPGSLTDEEYNQFQTRWRESHRGVSNAHRVAFLENGMAWQPQTMSPKDMDFSSLRSDGRDSIRGALRMHKVMVGQSDDVNRANAQTGEEVFASWEVVPRLDRKKDMLNNVFLPMFGATDVEFDYITPVPPNREQDNVELTSKASAAISLVNAGYDPHDVLEVVGLPDMGVAEKATQIPAAPPGWVPAPPPPQAPAGGAKPSSPSAAPGGEEVTNRLMHMLSNGHVPVNSGNSA